MCKAIRTRPSVPRKRISRSIAAALEGVVPLTERTLGLPPIALFLEAFAAGARIA